MMHKMVLILTRVISYNNANYQPDSVLSCHVYFYMMLSSKTYRPNLIYLIFGAS